MTGASHTHNHQARKKLVSTKISSEFEVQHIIDSQPKHWGKSNKKKERSGNQHTWNLHPTINGMTITSPAQKEPNKYNSSSRNTKNTSMFGFSTTVFDK